MNNALAHARRRRARLAAPRTDSGFTMVELLVAIAISSFLVITIFFVMTSSSRNFRVQTDIAQTSDRLNYAMDTIKNDLRRTSFMTVPNAYLPQTQYPWYKQVCSPPSWMPRPDGRMATAHAVWVRDGSGGGGVMDYYEPEADHQVLVGSTPDQLLLLGAFRANEPFRPTRMQSGATTITVPNGQYTDQQMRYIFDDAFISVSTPAGGLQFLAVQSVSASLTLPETTLNLRQPLAPDPTGTGLEACNFTGFGGGTFEVVPLHFVRYSIVTDPDDPESTVLVREELDQNASDLNTITRHIVARDIVDLQVWFDGVEAGGLANEVVVDGANSGDWTDDSGAVSNGLLAGNANAEPENVRFAYVQLSGRLDTALTRANPNGSGDALREYIELVDCDDSGVCNPASEWTRVITMRSEVELPNVTLANTRTNP